MNSDSTPEEAARLEELFPTECHFRVIAEDSEAIGRHISDKLAELGVTNPLEHGQASAGGKYRTYGVSVMVETRERMHFIDQELRAITGVRMVL
jgi:putative lipoic acid-binding regulatory protein